MCPLTLTASFLHGQRVRGTGMLASYILACARVNREKGGRGQAGHCRNDGRNDVTPGTSPLKVDTWTTTWRTRWFQVERDGSLVRSNSFRLLRAQPPNVSGNQTSVRRGSLHTGCSSLLYSSKAMKTNINTQNILVFKPLTFPRLSTGRAGLCVQTRWTRAAASLAGFNGTIPWWLIQSVTSSVLVKSLQCVCARIYIFIYMYVRRVGVMKKSLCREVSCS